MLSQRTLLDWHTSERFRSNLSRKANLCRNRICVVSCGGLRVAVSLHRNYANRGLRFHPTSATGRTANDLPQDWTQVMSWCRGEFRRCVSADLPDTALHLAKCCLLVALEEEAARSLEAPHPELQELMAVSSARLRPRSAASASTWSGERLEALAAEVASLLDQQLEESAQYRATTTAAAAAAAAPAPAPAGTSPEKDDAADGHDVRVADTAEAGLEAKATGAGSGDAATTAAAAGRPSTETSPSAEGLSQAPGLASRSFDFAEEQEQLLERIHTSRPGAVGSSSRGYRTGGQGSTREDGKGSEGGEDAGSRQYYGSAWPSRRRLYGKRQSLYRRYPIQTLAAVNTVLFDRHGYLPCNRYGVPSDHQLSAVLERGVGASAALSILYLEVCERLGFPLAARPLEDGRYFVLWPVDTPLTADGQRFLVDPYGRGGLLLLDEVCEIFGVDEASLQPASRRELLAALLGELRDAHWAAAAGCSPLPGSMIPLSVETALTNKVVVPTSGVCAASLQRALAAAEKRLWLLPDDGEAQLQYGLLLYFSRGYDDAWIELALYLERFAPRGGDGDQLPRKQQQQQQQLQGSGEVRSLTQSPPPVAAAGIDAVAMAPGEDPVQRPQEDSICDGQAPLDAAEREGAGQLEAPATLDSGPQDPTSEGVVTYRAAVEAAASSEGALSETVPLASEPAVRDDDLGEAVGPRGAAGHRSGEGDVEEEAVLSCNHNSSQAATVAEQVAILVERIRLVLDFAPLQKTG